MLLNTSLMQNEFRWYEDDKLIEKVFLKKASRLYSNRVSQWKKHWYLADKGCPPDVKNEEWDAFVRHWDSEKAKKKAEQARKNRMHEVQVGAGASKSYMGRCSIIERAARLVSN